MNLIEAESKVFAWRRIDPLPENQQAGRLGLIRVDSFDQVLVDRRRSMK